MNNEVKSAIQSACQMVLRPLASMVLRCGMTWKEFADLSKSVFVQAATEEFGINGRPTNVSRVSILTGISRKEVKRQRDLLANEAPAARGKTTDATRALSGWYQDPDYLDADSNPQLLPEQGPAPSFETLCATYGGDIAATTMLKELLNTQTVERTDDGRLRPVRRYYQPAVHDEENLRWAVSLIRDLADTMNNNVFLDKTGVARFGRKADNERIPETEIPEFKNFLDRKGQAFLEEIDDWLTEHVAADVIETGKCVRVGVGLFAIEAANPEESVK